MLCYGKIDGSESIVDRGHPMQTVRVEVTPGLVNRIELGVFCLGIGEALGCNWK